MIKKIAIWVGVILVLLILVVVIFSKKEPNTGGEKVETSPLPASASDSASLDASSSAQLKSEDLVEGTGAEAKSGDTVSVNYVGTLQDGTKFDSSYDRNQPFETQIGVGGVIKGWDLGIPGMKVGGKRRLTIPPELGYGPQANGKIPANSTLIFEVELLDVK
jgi:FKBP-type peptidyl-prolyl cis-trans isomerase FkpA